VTGGPPKRDTRSGPRLSLAPPALPGGALPRPETGTLCRSPPGREVAYAAPPPDLDRAPHPRRRCAPPLSAAASLPTPEAPPPTPPWIPPRPAARRLMPARRSSILTDL